MGIIPALRLLLETILPQKAVFNDYEVEHEFPTIGKRILLLNARQIPGPPKEPQWILLTFEDVTARTLLERTMQASEEHLRLVTDNMLDLVVRTDLQGLILYASPSHKTVLGYKPEYLVGKSVYDLVHPEDVDQVRAASLAALQDQKHGKLEYRYRHSDGQYLWLESAGALIFAESGSPAGAVFSTRDITERKQAQDGLRESQQLLEKTLSSLLDAVFIIDADTMEIRDCNPAASAIFGYNRQEMLSRTTAFLHVDLASLEEFRHHLNSDMEEKGFLFMPEFRMKRKDGTVFPTEHSVVPLENEKGKRIGWVSVVRDITERKQAEVVLRESEERFRSILDDIEDGYYYEVDTAGNFTFVNPALARMLGRPANELMGMNNRLYMTPEGGKAVFQIFKRVFRTGIPEQGLEWDLVRPDGTFRSVEVSVSLIKAADGSINGFRGTVRDTTERKRAEQALAESEIKCRWLYEYAPSAYHLLTPDGTLTDVNHRWCELLGYRKEEVLGRAIFDFVVEEEREAAKASFEEKKQNKEPYVEGSERNFKTKDGAVRTFKTHDFFVLDQRQNITSVQTTIEDITKRVRAEDELQESERKLKNAQMLGQFGNWSYDLESQTITWSDQVYQLYERDPVLGPPTPEEEAAYYSPEQAQILREYSTRAIQEGQSFEYDLEVNLPSGKHLYFSAKMQPVRDANGRIVRLFGTIQDITDRKRAENRIQKQLEHLTALSAIDRIISSIFDLKLSLSEILTHVTKELGIDAADILILNPSLQMLELGAERGFRTKAVRKAQVRLGESYAGRVALERQLIQIPNLSDEPDNSFLTNLLTSEDFVCYYGVPLIAKGQVKGVLEVFHRAALEPDAEWLDFLNALAGQAAIAIENSTLFESLQRSNSELALAYDATIEGWSHALDLRDKETEGHTQRVTELTVKLARAFGLSEAELVQVRWGALLHDIGKMGVPDGILLKPGPLTDEEWAVMKKHPTFAYEMLAPIRYLRLALDIPCCHHEKWDGSGYPRGLKGEQIPLVARIFAVVDVWDALISDRPYRKAWTEEKATLHIRAGAGTHFDAQVVKTFFLEQG